MSRSPSWRLPPLLLFAGAVACSQKPSIGIEAILDSTGLDQALLERSGGSFEVVVDESKNLLEKIKSGDLDLVVADDDLGIDALMRSGDAGSADPLLHGEVVLVGPDKDPLALHAERNFKNSLRLIIEGDAAFFQCVPCGTRARAEALFAQLPDLPHSRTSFVDVGKSDQDVVKAMQSAPGYAFLSRPTVIRKMKEQEWSFKPLWSGDPLEADTYRVIVRPSDRIDAPKRDAIAQLKKFLLGDDARSIIEKFGADAMGQPYFRPGPAVLGEGARF